MLIDLSKILVIYDPSAFEFLESKGKSQQDLDSIRRTSLLLKFDPLCQQIENSKPAPSSLDNLKEEPENEISPALLRLNQEIPSSLGIQITTKSLKVSSVDLIMLKKKY